MVVSKIRHARPALDGRPSASQRTAPGVLRRLPKGGLLIVRPDVVECVAAELDTSSPSGE
jgi:hypothetical protein